MLLTGTQLIMNKWAKDLLYRKLDLEKYQRPDLTMDMAIESLENSANNNEIVIVASEEKQIIHILRPVSPWSAEYDIVADCPGMLTLYKACSKATNWFWDTYPHMHRLEMVTANYRVGVLAEKLGWTQEGYKIESYKDYNTGKWRSEFTYSLLNPNHKTED